MKTLVLLPLLLASLFIISCSKSETSDPAADLTANTDGSIVVTNGSNTYSGTWLLSSSNSSSDDTLYDDKSHRFTITIAGDKLMQKLSKKWLSVKVTENEIWLSDDNPSSNEHLHFGR